MDVDNVLQSIRVNVSNILNTRAGSCLLDTNFGIQDFTNINLGEDASGIFNMEKNLSALIMRYEPRLDKVSVSFDAEGSSTLKRHFVMDGTMKVQEGKIITIQFSTYYREGAFSVE